MHAGAAQRFEVGRFADHKLDRIGPANAHARVFQHDDGVAQPHREHGGRAGAPEQHGHAWSFSGQPRQFGIEPAHAALVGQKPGGIRRKRRLAALGAG